MIEVFRQSFQDQFRSGQHASERDAADSLRYPGVNDDILRDLVHQHITTLMNTVRLDAALALDDAPHVARSILNYGFRDLSNLTRNELTGGDIARSIRQSLSDHEPRLKPNTIRVKVESLDGDALQRISVFVSAELIADPADIPVEFKADVDIGAGKVIMNAGRI